MTSWGPPAPAQPAGRDAAALPFLAEMYGLQADHLQALLQVSERQSRRVLSRWLSEELVSVSVLSPGPRWVWLTKTGLRAVGASYPAVAPALSRLAHLRAVASVRLALEATPGYNAGGAHWRSERRLRSRLGRPSGATDHLPDGEVHWPDLPESGEPRAFAGECWAIEAELTPKTVVRTEAVMRELLSRTGDYGCPAAQASVPGLPPRHDRVVYVCSPAAASTVERARGKLSPALAGRVEIRALPPCAYLAAPG